MGSEINLGTLVLDLAGIFKPPERLTVAEAAFKYVHLSDPPKYDGPYLPNETPYMIEPMNLSVSRDHTAIIFCGPAQSGKTQGIVLNVMAYFIMCNPMDIILYHMSQRAARDFSIRRIDRMQRHSKHIKSQVREGEHADNVHDKRYLSGMMLSISWPSINEMSSKPCPIVMFTDYERMPDDIDGEGSPFILGQKRTQTYRNMGLTIVDSSPGRPIEEESEEERLRVKGAHEAPPCKGILSLYNQGDRRRWYWPCTECGEFFEPSFSLLTYNRFTTADGKKIPLSIHEAAQTTKMACPNNGCLIDEIKKREMNLKGVWLREGEKIDKFGNRSGTGLVSKTASYWLKGPAATYITWKEMVTKFLNAEDAYERTRDQTELQATVNTDQAEPYKPKGSESARVADDLQKAALKELPAKMVPLDVRALMAHVDVQNNMFVVQVHGVRPGKPYDIVVIDRFSVRKSERLDADGERLWVKPHSYLEDWNVLIEEVINKKYPLETEDGEMAISHTFCDSGGKGRSHAKQTSEEMEGRGVTFNAYNFWRKLKKEGVADRFTLVKGDSNRASPRAHLEYPDAERKDRSAGARGEIPVLFLNVNSLKDTLNALLGRDESGGEEGGGKIDFPAWLPRSWFEELVSEHMTTQGWMKIGSRRNEAWDLLAYCIGSLVWKRVEKVNWASPPPWLAPWEENPRITWRDKKQGAVDKKDNKSDVWAALGAELS